MHRRETNVCLCDTLISGTLLSHQPPSSDWDAGGCCPGTDTTSRPRGQCHTEQEQRGPQAHQQGTRVVATSGMLSPVPNRLLSPKAHGIESVALWFWPSVRRLAHDSKYPLNQEGREPPVVSSPVAGTGSKSAACGTSHCEHRLAGPGRGGSAAPRRPVSMRPRRARIRRGSAHITFANKRGSDGSHVPTQGELGPARTPGPNHRLPTASPSLPRSLRMGPRCRGSGPPGAQAPDRQAQEGSEWRRETPRARGRRLRGKPQEGSGCDRCPLCPELPFPAASARRALPFRTGPRATLPLREVTSLA